MDLILNSNHIRTNAHLRINRKWVVCVECQLVICTVWFFVSLLFWIIFDILGGNERKKWNIREELSGRKVAFCFFLTNGRKRLI